MKLRVNPRIGTALVLIPIVLGVTLYGAHGLFAGLCAVVVLAGAWEWARLAGPRHGLWKIVPAAGAGLLLALCYINIDGMMTLVVVGLSLVWWGAALILIIRQQHGGEFSREQIVREGVGMLVLVPAWVSLVALHAHPEFQGPVLVACLFVIIWAADTGAYYTGKRWGKHKLAVRVSPGKTLEGLFGALGFGLFAALLCALLLQMAWFRVALFLLVCLITIAMSVVGDLTESLVKRSGGVKDSGGLLPGHGGVLDRIDSLTAAAPVFFAGVLLLERAP